MPREARRLYVYAKLGGVLVSDLRDLLRTTPRNETLLILFEVEVEAAR